MKKQPKWITDEVEKRAENIVIDVARAKAAQFNEQVCRIRSIRDDYYHGASLPERKKVLASLRELVSQFEDIVDYFEDRQVAEAKGLKK